jgi:ribosomal protein S18 acetylase RimI-like enzyme
VIQRFAPAQLTPALVEQVLRLDRTNMAPVFAALGREFPEALVRKGLLGPTTEVIAAFDGDALAGYVEFCRDWNDADDLYLVSIQIAREHQGGVLFRQLVRELMRVLSTSTFRRLTSNVQSTNPKMVRIFRKLGFELTPSKSSAGSFDATATAEQLASRQRLLRIRSSES